MSEDPFHFAVLVNLERVGRSEDPFQFAVLVNLERVDYVRTRSSLPFLLIWNGWG